MTVTVPEPETAGPLRYAPKWVQSQVPAEDIAGGVAQKPPFSDRHRRRSGNPGTQSFRMLEPPWRRKAARPSFEGDIAIMELRSRLALAPDEIPDPQFDRPPGRLLGSRGRFACIVMLAAGGTLGYFWLSVPQSKPAARPLVIADFEANGPLVLPVAISGFERSGERASPSSSPRPIDRTQALSGEAESNATRRTASLPVGPAEDVASPAATVRAAERRLPEGGGAPVPPEFAAPPSTEPTPDQDEIAGLVARGRNYFATGDVAAARLVLRRAANAGNSQAALALGGSYDPIILKQLGVIGVAGDQAQAREWYSRAAELGSVDAARRLNQLVQTDR